MLDISICGDDDGESPLHTQQKEYPILNARVNSFLLDALSFECFSASQEN